MPKLSICPVVLAGGSGSRLWPLSRSMHPKQFLNLWGDETMLQSTLNRLDDLAFLSYVTVANEQHRFFVAEQLLGINKPGSIILEPSSKNTAPAIALAALTAIDDPIMLVLASDHYIKNKEEFTKAIKSAIPFAESGKLVTFGIIPTEAQTGYGYIKRGPEFKHKNGLGYNLDSFIEKPTRKKAKEYLASDDYYWNSGMFMFKASRYIEELEKFRPDILSPCKEAVKKAVLDLDFLRIDNDAFSSCPSESVDYAIMEKTKDGIIIPMDAGWSDVGNWSSLSEIEEKDSFGNTYHGDVIIFDSKNTYVKSDENLVSVVGVEDLVIISTKDVVMVMHKDNAEDVKLIVDKLKKDSRSEWESHREVYRPWGKYDSIDRGSSYQVKRITVNPGAKLSVQKHEHRSEHWVVVAGEAIVTKGKKTFTLSKNESTYIPIGVVHSLENNTSDSLEIIEVQSGSYLGEDDIIRFEDRYGRVPVNKKK